MSKNRNTRRRKVFGVPGKAKPRKYSSNISCRTKCYNIKILTLQSMICPTCNKKSGPRCQQHKRVDVIILGRAKALRDMNSFGTHVKIIVVRHADQSIGLELFAGQLILEPSQVALDFLGPPEGDIVVFKMQGETLQVRLPVLVAPPAR
jgi:hypothetical protein